MPACTTLVPNTRAVEHAAHEPDRSTAPELHQVRLEERQMREPIFHHPELGTTREDFKGLTDPNFWETGASGRYNREHVWEVLKQRYASAPSGQPDDWQTSDFERREIAPTTYLLTYKLLQGTRLTRRVTVRQRHAVDSTVLYHQGTPVADHDR